MTYSVVRAFQVIVNAFSCSSENIALCHSPSKMNPLAEKDLGKRDALAVTSPGAN
jgi:hypothetical protein